MADPTHVVSTTGVRYRLGRCLGEGGQGRVYAVEGGRFVAKVLLAGVHVEPRRLERHIQFLRTLDLEGIPIAQPEAVLAEPHTGYLMRFLDGMEPMQALLKPPAASKSVRQWYLESGGLRRRLRVCAEAALAVAMLHSKGLCYGDVSPSNIFVAAAADSERVCLIDADNLRFESSRLRQPVYTPGYGAPEVVAGVAPVSTVSDAHALAVTVFSVLALAHPLLGDAVERGEPELEERALLGQLPWIDHSTDDSNRSSLGVPRVLVCSRVLQDVVRRTFEQGLQDPLLRPSAMEWAEALAGAARNCLLCANCHHAFLRSAAACPWCEKARPAFVRGQIRLWDPEGAEGRGGFVLGPDKKDLVVDTFSVAERDQLTVDTRLALGLRPTAKHRELLRVGLESGRLTLTRLTTDVAMELQSPPYKETMPAVRALQLKAGGWCKTSVHFGEVGRLHRVLDLWYAEGTQP